MLSIDEAIARERELSERNLILLDFDELVQKSYDTYLRAEYHEQLVMWLEELKVLKENSISKEAFEKMKTKAHNHGRRQGYAKAIDEFAEKAIKIVYDSNDRDRNPQPRDMVADIHYKLMDLAKLLKEQNK